MDHTAYMEAAKKAASPDELKELAAAAGMELTDEKAKEYFDKLKGEGEPPSSEIAEENLAGIAGGANLGSFSDPGVASLSDPSDIPIVGKRL
jgi:hypothetical protein